MKNEQFSRLSMQVLVIRISRDVYREVAVTSREERRPCFLVTPGLLQNVSNL